MNNLATFKGMGEERTKVTWKMWFDVTGIKTQAVTNSVHQLVNLLLQGELYSNSEANFVVL